MRDVSQTGAVSIGHLSEIERGIKEASSSVIEGIAKALGVSTSYLVIEAGYLMGVSEVPDTIEDFIDEYPASANPSPVS
jgi:transcriptional regulator with XRE-family HTH domain